jgi:O-acetyl-ADP-ribose deacetylase (regulator of RNase III)
LIVAVIRYTQGDILQADAEALVNTVNCVGVMGRGIALHFKNAYPDNFKAYAAACERREVQPGRMFVYETGSLAPRWIVNFPTKRHWRGKSRIDDIEAGMTALVDVLRECGIRSVAIPPLGSGLGGLAWKDVRAIIERGLAELPEVEAIVYEPGGKTQDTRSRVAPKMTAGRAALVGLIKRYLTGMMDTSITLLEVHKLMYFLQEAGEPLRLRYAKAPYGPYAENLRHVLRAVNGHLVDGYSAEGDSPTEEIALRPGAAKRADAFLGEHPDTQERFARVAELVDGYETPFGLELLATVHWVASNEDASTEERIVEAFYAWSPRKKQFSPEQIDIAIDHLRVGGWLPEPIG